MKKADMTAMSRRPRRMRWIVVTQRSDPVHEHALQLAGLLAFPDARHRRSTPARLETLEIVMPFAAADWVQKIDGSADVWIPVAPR
jgi:hypothetical protein